MVDAARRRHATLVLAGVGLVVLGILLAQAAYGEPVRERHSEERVRWAAKAEYDYAVPITHNSSLWSPGTYQPMGAPSYYLTVSDHFLLNFSWRTEMGTPGTAGPRSGSPAATPAGGAAEGVVHASLVMRLRGQDGQGRVHWEVQEPMAEAFSRDPSSGVAMAVRVDLDQVQSTITRLTRELPMGESFLNWSFEAVVAYAMRVEGQPEAATERFVFPARLSDPRLLLPAPKEVQWTQTHTSLSSHVVSHEAGWEGILGSLRIQVIFLGGLALVGLALWAHSTDPARGAPAQDAAFLREHARHAEWVTTASGPLDPSAFPPSVVDLASLEALVEAAADARVRIVLDPASRVFYAVLPTLTYRYAAHAKDGRVPRTGRAWVHVEADL